MEEPNNGEEHNRDEEQENNDTSGESDSEYETIEEDSDLQDIDESPLNSDDDLSPLDLEGGDGAEAAAGAGGRVRLIPRILQLFRQHSNRRDDTDTADNDEDEPRSSAANSMTFDRSLPSQHLYLGAGSEVQGRTMFDEDEMRSLPILHHPHFVLMPGQQFPLTFFDAGMINMVRSTLAGNKTFGMIGSFSGMIGAGNLSGVVGTTAEIYEYGEVSQGSVGETVGFRIKAKGRQRFRLQSTRTDPSTGINMGLVTMLPEVTLTNPPYYTSRLRSCDRKGSRVARQRNIQALCPFPTYIYSMYHDTSLIARMRKMLENCGMNSDQTPNSGEELSWWVASMLPIQDSWKYQLLGINCSIQRLRVELCILSLMQVLMCRRCSLTLAEQSDIFSMSSEGPQGAFVNPGGHLHETLTVYKAKNLKLVGEPSTEYSWFPGYAWTIVECSRCYNHIGWKFTAAKSGLKPLKFYGFSRKSINSGFGSRDVRRPDEEEAMPMDMSTFFSREDMEVGAAGGEADTELVM